jgi:hypothetical protein
MANLAPQALLDPLVHQAAQAKMVNQEAPVLLEMEVLLVPLANLADLALLATMELLVLLDLAHIVLQLVWPRAIKHDFNLVNDNIIFNVIIF